jgi:hypothetical protein
MMDKNTVHEKPERALEAKHLGYSAPLLILLDSTTPDGKTFTGTEGPISVAPS